MQINAYSLLLQNNKNLSWTQWYFVTGFMLNSFVQRERESGLTFASLWRSTLTINYTEFFMQLGKCCQLLFTARIRSLSGPRPPPPPDPLVGKFRIQWRIQDFSRGCVNPQVGAPGYEFIKFRPKTAGNWEKMLLRGRLLDPPLSHVGPSGRIASWDRTLLLSPPPIQSHCSMK